jgi:hypothetical protein
MLHLLASHAPMTILTLALVLVATTNAIASSLFRWNGRTWLVAVPAMGAWGTALMSLGQAAVTLSQSLVDHLAATPSEAGTVLVGAAVCVWLSLTVALGVLICTKEQLQQGTGG